MIKRLIVILFLLFCFKSGWSQSFLGWQLHDRYFSVYGGTGWTGYIGELTNKKPFSQGLSHYNIGVEARLYSRVAARVQFSRFDLRGNDQNAPDSTFNRQRNLSFESTNYEWQVEAVYYFLKYRDKYYKRRAYEPYVAAGIGQVFYSPSGALIDTAGISTSYDLRSLNTEGDEYNKSSIIIPVHLGVKAAINEFINLSLDLGYRFTFTGHLDDVNASYNNSLSSESIAAQLSNRKDEVGIINEAAYNNSSRGNGTNDGYFLVNLNLELYLPRDLFRSKNGKRKKEKILGKPSAYD